MNLDIAGKAVVVTGAAGGIGRALALGLAAHGARVAVIARDLQRAQHVVDEIAQLPDSPAALAVEADVSDETAVREAAATLDRTWGRLDALINNAGWMHPANRILDTDVATLRRALDANLVSAYLATKHFAPLMIRGGGGRVIYLSSAAGVQSGPGMSPYGSAKAGVNILANVAHQELADDGIRTTALAPGLTYSPGMREIVGDEHLRRVAAQYPGGRIGEPDDLVGLAAFLCSDAAAHISGSTMFVRPPVNG